MYLFIALNRRTGQVRVSKSIRNPIAEEIGLEILILWRCDDRAVLDELRYVIEQALAPSAMGGHWFDCSGHAAVAASEQAAPKLLEAVELLYRSSRVMHSEELLESVDVARAAGADRELIPNFHSPNNNKNVSTGGGKGSAEGKGGAT